MNIEECIYSKKKTVVQNGDFKDIYNIIKNFQYRNIYLVAPVIYAEQNITAGTTFKQIETSVTKKANDNISLDLVDKKELQIIQLSISNILDGDNNKKYYLPIFKNVIFEKKDAQYIATYFVILNLFNSKGKNGILKLAI